MALEVLCYFQSGEGWMQGHGRVQFGSYFGNSSLTPPQTNPSLT